MTLHTPEERGLRTAINEAVHAQLPRRSSLSGVVGILVATLFWGCSFLWVKAAGAGINDALALGAGSPVGPLALLGWRFFAAGILWALFHWRALRGWSGRSLVHALQLGTALAIPMIFQVLGLDRTSEAVSAFLTSLTIVFVPLTLTFLLRRPPAAYMWLPVALAALGIWLMTGAAPSGFGLGELLGLGCGLSFTAHILLIDSIMPRETLGRMTLGQFVFVGVVCLVAAAIASGGHAFTPDGLRAQFSHGADTVALSPQGLVASQSVVLNLALVVLFSTLGAFTLQFAFQPRITPTLAAVVLLAEPVFAALFAYVMMGRSLGTGALVGAGLILLANLFAIRRSAAPVATSRA